MNSRPSQARVLVGDCRELMRSMADASIDAIVTDPPYELGFMGKKWDASGIAYDLDVWREALRVLKPGGHLLAFGGTRTYHRMTCAIEDAGFEVRDSIHWIYGSGFPKSLDVSKAMDKARDDSQAGLSVGAWLKSQRVAKGLKQKDVAALWPSASGGLTGCVANWETLGKVPKWDQWMLLKEFIGFGDEMDSEVWRLNNRKGSPGEDWFNRKVIGFHGSTLLEVAPGEGRGRPRVVLDVTAPATDAARQWAGWGTALKPAHEPIVVARKPLVGTVAANVLEHGTGAVNVDACRVGTAGGTRKHGPPSMQPGNSLAGSVSGVFNGGGCEPIDAGRWPANIVLCHSPDCGDECAEGCAVAEMDRQSGMFKGQVGMKALSKVQFKVGGNRTAQQFQQGSTDFGGASRFFPCFRYQAKASKRDRGDGNTHPTVKPVELMRWLVRLVTPPGGLVLDPFTGSGTTGVACVREGFDFVGLELLDNHADIARRRIEAALAQQPTQMALDVIGSDNG